MLRLLPNSDSASPSAPRVNWSDLFPAPDTTSQDDPYLDDAAPTHPTDAAGIAALSSFCADVLAVIHESTYLLRYNRIATVFCLACGLMYLPLAWLWSEPQGTARGVRVAGVAVQGLTLLELRNQVEHTAQRRAEPPLRLAISLSPESSVTAPGAPTLSVKPHELVPREPSHVPTVPFKTGQAVAQAYLVGREPSPLARIRSRLATWQDIDIRLPVKLDPHCVTRVLGRFNSRPRNASVKLVDGRVQIVPDQPGAEVPVTPALLKISHALEAGETFVLLPARSRPAAITGRMLQEATSVRASVMVPITSRHPNARRNAKIAATALKLVLVLPGQTLSLNQAIGPRSAQAGYGAAPVFINGEADLAIGGGICTVSTAVFQAAALAGLEIVERHSHSRRVRYAAPGLDATLNWGTKDLRIRNNTPAALIFCVMVKKQRITARVLGMPLTDEIRLATVPGRKPGTLLVTTTRITNGKLARLCQSNYRF